MTSASSLEEKNTICWRRACGSGGLERIVDLRVCKSNVENAAQTSCSPGVGGKPC